MDKLWAPWRETYIKNPDKSKKGSLFTDIIKSKNDRKNHVLIRTAHSVAVLNIYPYSNGHMLIVPKRKVNDLTKLAKIERDDLWDLLDLTKSLLKEVLKPQGFNIGINLGRAAGAGVPEHLHVHLVPRWRGDINFMPVVGNTKVISQSLDNLYKMLSDAYTRRNRKTGR